MDKTQNTKEFYLQSFKNYERTLNGESKSFIHKVRKDALEKLNSIEFPTLKDEEWRYTNISPILKKNFNPSLEAKKISLSKNDLKNYLIPGLEGHNIVILNGIFNKDLSSIGKLSDKIIIESLNSASQNNQELFKQYFGKLSGIDNAFSALNTAFSMDGVFIYLPDNKIIEEPIAINYISGNSEQNVLSTPRNLFIAGKNSQMRIVENFVSYDKSVYLSAIVTEVFVDEHGIVDLYKIQNENEYSYHIAKVQASQKDKSVFSSYSFSFGAAIARNNINHHLDGENIESHLYGLYLASGTQHVDHHTFVDHAKPNCFSNELYKGILDDNSSGVFSGKILVRQDAQKTNAYQSNKSLLLSPDAKSDTKPQLEIFADDVKCSHGATIGQIDESALFYVKSRGIPDDLARSMLIRAFANDVIENIKIEDLKEYLNHLIFEHLHRVEI